MRIDPIKLETKSKLLDEYRNHGEIIKKFDYPPYSPSTFEKRVEDLNNRTFNRKGLVSVLHNLNEKWGASDKTLTNINRLKEENSVVVIGGQQAGLLTGPLYTIHKIISIINLAKEQEQKLKIPVIPVFWIAGEDHDFDEINHIMLEKQSRMKKYKIPQRVTEKKSMSELSIDKEVCEIWLNRIFEELSETEYTSSYHQSFLQQLQDSDTVVDFFAKVIHQLFNEQGIVLIDSGNHAVRQLESNHFKSMIENQPTISSLVYQTNQEVKQAGYSISVDVDENDAHLFYHKNDERILLIRGDEDKWIGKQNECQFTTEELVHMAETNPELLSNNVVTRPIMQELLFPSLAFLAGPGEIGYWSILKPAFHALGITMPPVLPRLSLSFIDSSINKKLNRFTIDPSQVVNFGVELERGNWLASQTEAPIEKMTDQVKFSVERAHRPLRELAKSIRSDLGDVAEKNLFYLFQDLEFLEDKLMRAIEQKHVDGLADFDSIHNALYPEEGLQERCWNITPFLNLYGSDFINELAEQKFDYQKDHYLIYL